MRDNFDAVGVDGTHVTTADAPTGIAVVIVGAEDSTNSIVVVPGANAELTAADVEDASAIFDGASVLLCQMEVPPETTLRALELARENNCLSVLNTAPVPPGGVPEALIRAADVVCPNEVELAELAGVPGESTKTLEGALAAARVLLDRGAGTVLATLGGDGASDRVWSPSLVRPIPGGRGGGGGAAASFVPRR